MPLVSQVLMLSNPTMRSTIWLGSVDTADGFCDKLERSVASGDEFSGLLPENSEADIGR